MSTRFSAHPALASEHLQSTEPSARHHRRHHSAGAGLCSGSGCGTTPKSKFYSRFAKLSSNTNGAVPESASSSAAKFSTFDAPQKTLPVRTAIAPDANADADADGVDTDVEVELDMDDDDDSGVAANNTKDCVDCAPPSAANDCSAPGRPALSAAFIDEPDHLQYRFSRTHHSSAVDGGHRQHFASTTHHCDADMCASSASIHAISDGCISGLSSSISSPSASTVSSPLSTPTRLPPHFAQHGHQHCCQQAAAGGDSGSTLSHLHLHHHQHQHHHHHHHHASSPTAASSNGAAASGCKKLQKFDPRLGPSRYRQLLPILLCILSFAIVFSILIVYMDTTEIRHKQFRLNMSRDSEWFSVAQDDPTLIAFLREIHMRKYPLHFLKNARDTTPAAAAASHFNFSAHYDGLTPEMAHYVAELVGGKMNGAVIQSLPGTLGHLMTAPWLAQTLNWAGVVVEPQPRRFFTLLKQNAQRPRLQVVHACVSPNPYPKEVTIHNEESEVRINSLLDEETSWFNSRVKCFPLYSIMLACNRVEYDLLSLGVHGHELEVLQTLPFDKIRIEVISIHLPDDREDLGREYIQMLTKFLMGKSYKLQKRFGRNYFYQRINTTSRTRKKDILLLKTP